ncbi:MAG: response regulator transcription factor [Actinomycetota bacterium]
MGVKRGRAFLVEFDELHAQEHANAMKEWGWSVDYESADGALACKHIIDNPPDLVVIDLDHFPSQGREAGRAVRTAIPDIPIVFVNGSSESATRALGVVPGSMHTTYSELDAILRNHGRLRIVSD